MEADDRVEDPESPPLFLAGHVDLDLLDVAHDLLLNPTMDLFPAIEDRLALDGPGGVDLDDGTGGSRDRRGALERRQERFRRQAIRVLYLCNLYESATVRTVRLELLQLPRTKMGPRDPTRTRRPILFACGTVPYEWVPMAQ